MVEGINFGHHIYYNPNNSPDPSMLSDDDLENRFQEITIKLMQEYDAQFYGNKTVSDTTINEASSLSMEILKRASETKKISSENFNNYGNTRAILEKLRTSVESLPSSIEVAKPKCTSEDLKQLIEQGNKILSELAANNININDASVDDFFQLCNHYSYPDKYKEQYSELGGIIIKIEKQKTATPSKNELSNNYTSVQKTPIAPTESSSIIKPKLPKKSKGIKG